MERPSLRFHLLSEIVASLGSGEAFAVRSTSHPERAYLVFKADSTMDWPEPNWACACPADHARLRDEGRYCSTIEKVRKTLNG